MACNYWFFIWAVSSVYLLFMPCNHWFFFYFELSHLYLNDMQLLIFLFWAVSTVYLFCWCHAIIDFFILSCLICIFVVYVIQFWFFLYWAVSSVSLLFMPCNYWFFLFLAVSSVYSLFMPCNYWIFIGSFSFNCLNLILLWKLEKCLTNIYPFIEKRNMSCVFRTIIKRVPRIRG